MKQPHTSSTFPHHSPTSFKSPVPETIRSHRDRGWLKQQQLFLVLLLPLCLVTLSLPWKQKKTTIIRSPKPPHTQQTQFQSDLSLLCLCASIVALQLLQFFSCSARSRNKHWFLHCCVWVSYYMPVPLAAYAMGVMLRFRPSYWLVATLFAAGHTDAMAAYSLHDDNKGVRRFAKQALGLLQLTCFSVSLFQFQPQLVPPPSLSWQWQHHAMKVCSVVLGFFVFFLRP